MDTLLAHPTSHAHMPKYNPYRYLILKTKIVSKIYKNPRVSCPLLQKKSIFVTSDTSFSLVSSLLHCIDNATQ